jgi:hypothetical protein
VDLKQVQIAGRAGSWLCPDELTAIFRAGGGAEAEQTAEAILDLLSGDAAGVTRSGTTLAPYLPCESLRS